MPPERECCPRRTPHSVCKGRRVGNGSRHIQSVCFLRPFLARVVRGRVFPLASWGRMRLSARLWFILLVLLGPRRLHRFDFLHLTRDGTFCQNAGNRERDTKPRITHATLVAVATTRVASDKPWDPTPQRARQCAAPARRRRAAALRPSRRAQSSLATTPAPTVLPPSRKAKRLVVESGPPSTLGRPEPGS